jgi:hypothetical protein
MAEIDLNQTFPGWRRSGCYANLIIGLKYLASTFDIHSSLTSTAT